MRSGSRVIALLAAEPSGDYQGAALAQELRRRDPEVQLFGIGGNHMRSVGMDLLFDTSGWATVGPVEAIPRLPRVYRDYQALKRALAERRPDLTVMIDSPAIHMRLAGYLKKLGLRSLYYFPPSAWSANPRRAAQICDRVDAVLATFAYTAEHYQRCSLPVAYFGHPLSDQFQAVDAEQARLRLGLPQGTYVALLPGSRTQEIRLTLPLLLEVAHLLHQVRPDLQFLLPCASAGIEDTVRARVIPRPEYLHILAGSSREALACSRIALITSGSATLEAALLKIPLVLFYRINWLDYSLGRTLIALGLLSVPRFGLPNLVLQRDILPELLQQQVTPVRLVEESLALLDDGPRRAQMLQDFEALRGRLGQPGAVGRIGAFVDLFSRGLSLEEARAQVERGV